MTFNRESTLKDIALSNPAARRVLEDTGLDYCCGGSQSLDEACLRASITANEILGRLRENAKNVSPDEAYWLAAPLRELTRHIRDQHHRYVRESIPRTQELLQKVIAKHGSDHPELSDIHRVFVEVRKEMIMHMQKEEQILFPYIDALELAAKVQGSVEPPFFQTIKNPIHAMMKEHDAAGELIRTIHRLSGAYTAPAEACTSFKALYEGFKEFERDLRQQLRLKNDVLFPRAVELEAAVA
jgi:regulator of cell morphogenesis and NO signaling